MLIIYLSIQYPLVFTFAVILEVLSSTDTSSGPVDPFSGRDWGHHDSHGRDVYIRWTRIHLSTPSLRWHSVLILTFF